MEERPEALPAGYAADPAALRAERVARLELAAQRLRAVDVQPLAHTAVRRFLASRAPDLSGAFAEAAGAAPDDPPSAAALRRRPGTVAYLVDRDQRVDLVLGDRTLGFPADVAPALAAVLERDSVADADLAEYLDPPGRAVLLRRLREEGLLDGVPGDGPADGPGDPPR